MGWRSRERSGSRDIFGMRCGAGVEDMGRARCLSIVNVARALSELYLGLIQVSKHSLFISRIVRRQGSNSSLKRAASTCRVVPSPAFLYPRLEPHPNLGKLSRRSRTPAGMEEDVDGS